MDMTVQSFPGLIELGLAGLEMEALPEGEWAIAHRLRRGAALILIWLLLVGIGGCKALETLNLWECRSLASLPEGRNNNFPRWFILLPNESKIMSAADCYA